MILPTDAKAGVSDLHTGAIKHRYAPYCINFCPKSYMANNTTFLVFGRTWVKLRGVSIWSPHGTSPSDISQLMGKGLLDGLGLSGNDV